ncbi:hypothetical protein [Butyrivibrio sp. AC2005]|uniref:hypothetical protein n=1 Tax=Butyrivibrio sp. AC2005 TaxID=1280672 RepID=UPI00041BD2C7|nr:hypothetical protein [Butyrivibrio sp. AC2005]
MYRKMFKGRAVKRTVPKCKGVCKTYNDIQLKYADSLADNNDIVEFRCNVLIEGLTDGDYTSDIVATKKDGEILVRECLYRKYLIKPKTCRLLEQSRQYWLRRGVTDWGVVIEKEVDACE